jgi:putative ATPase
LAHLYQQSPQEFPYNAEQLNSLEIFRPVRYDKNRDEHYDTISAFIKSVRGSDPDAAVYYLARMLQGGEDPVFIARRLVILASEDIGNADPKGLPLAVACLQAVELIGMPEARISLSQVTTYLACAPKSNRAYLAINQAMEVVNKTGTLPIPNSLRSAQTKFAKNLGFGEDYKYSHDYSRGFADQEFLPSELREQKFYEPSEHGFEKNIKAYLEWLRGKKS